jgi:hypothetical protein
MKMTAQFHAALSLKLCRGLVIYPCMFSVAVWQGTARFMTSQESLKFNFEIFISASFISLLNLGHFYNFALGCYIYSPLC